MVVVVSVCMVAEGGGGEAEALVVRAAIIIRAVWLVPICTVKSVLPVTLTRIIPGGLNMANLVWFTRTKFSKSTSLTVPLASTAKFSAAQSVG